MPEAGYNANQADVYVYIASFAQSESRAGPDIKLKGQKRQGFRLPHILLLTLQAAQNHEPNC